MSEEYDDKKYNEKGMKEAEKCVDVIILFSW